MPIPSWRSRCCRWPRCRRRRWRRWPPDCTRRAGCTGWRPAVPLRPVPGWRGLPGGVAAAGPVRAGCVLVGCLGRPGCPGLRRGRAGWGGAGRAPVAAAVVVGSGALLVGRRRGGRGRGGRLPGARCWGAVRRRTSVRRPLALVVQGRGRVLVRGVLRVLARGAVPVAVRGGWVLGSAVVPARVLGSVAGGAVRRVRAVACPGVVLVLGSVAVRVHARVLGPGVRVGPAPGSVLVGVVVSVGVPVVRVGVGSVGTG